MIGRWLFLSAALSLLLGACESAGSSGDAGTSKAGLIINAALLGLTIEAFPVNNESGLDGWVLVKLDGRLVAPTAIVTVNGKALKPVDNVSGAFQVNPADVPIIESDGQLTIAASASGRSASITVECPEDLTMTTSPPAGAALAVGDRVTVSWPRELFVNDTNSWLFEPTLTMQGYDGASNAAAFNKAMANLAKGARSGTVDALSASESGYLLTLTFPGVLKYEDGNSAICFRTNRVVFSKK